MTDAVEDKYAMYNTLREEENPPYYFLLVNAGCFINLGII